MKSIIGIIIEKKLVSAITAGVCVWVDDAEDQLQEAIREMGCPDWDYEEKECMD